ncbi:hypothetical protein SAMN03159341_110185 [Paenibacillus sp. 1_12]|uniref:hypothetical protein n=1 Tax=Paenibacillus sp. 1_12 TaxID=1566278 RepID=UPI0008F29646|nr:hypothetical protein [Paenibacillus sp. 1_12]SFL83952.1 hypothetical protein SAMN03159341_110185 [Paenibacillus sp. 1_12]
MDFTSHDIAVIEQALHLAMRMGGNDSKTQQFREVLVKLQSNSAAAFNGTYLQKVEHDGLRYDYDDSSDML